MLMLTEEEKQKIINKYKTTSMSNMFLLKDDRVVFTAKGSKSVVPSDMYPLSLGRNQRENNFRMFTAVNSNANDESELEQEVMEVFNDCSFPPGFCYSSTQTFIDKCKEKGITNVKPYTGWLLVVDRLVHHSWVVYKDKYVIDGSINVLSFLRLLEEKEQNPMDKDDTRGALLKHVTETEKLPNIETRIFANMPPIFIYVGVEVDPNEGRLIFQDFMSRYPEHPSYTGDGVSGFGASEFQKKYYKDKDIEVTVNSDKNIEVTVKKETL